jgi:hypothetical protein
MPDNDNNINAIPTIDITHNQSNQHNIMERSTNIADTLKYFNRDLMKLSKYATEEECQAVLIAYEQSLRAVQQLKDKYETNFRRSDTQLIYLFFSFFSSILLSFLSLFMIIFYVYHFHQKIQ